MPRGANQHLPTPPRADLERWIAHYWRLKFTDKAIANHVLDHFDRTQYGLSAKTVSRIRKSINLLGARQRDISMEELTTLVQTVKTRFPHMGSRALVNKIRIDYGTKVSERRMLQLVRVLEPEAVRSRKGRKFKRKIFHAAGVMDIIAMDQHDKWMRFGLYLHVGVDPYPGRISWLKIWWTNKNPRLIGSYFIEFCRQVGGVSIITQSDLGTENYGIANIQTYIRQSLDPELAGTLQHRWMSNTKNIKPEAHWSVQRKHWTPAFEDLLDRGVAEGLYDINDPDPLEKLIFRWVAIPFFQAELDNWKDLRNNTKRRASAHKVLPDGIPDLIHAKPERFGCQNFMIPVPPELFDEAEALYAPKDDPVHELVPPAFQLVISEVYDVLGRPPITFESFWDVYQMLVEAMRALPEASTNEVSAALAQADNSFDVPMELMPNQKKCKYGYTLLDKEKEENERAAQSPNSEDTLLEIDESELEEGDDEDDEREFLDWALF